MGSYRIENYGMMVFALRFESRLQLYCYQRVHSATNSKINNFYNIIV